MPKASQDALLAQLLEFKELYAFGSMICPDVLGYQKLAALIVTLVRYIDKKEAQKSARLPLKVVAATVVGKEPDADCDGDARGPVMDAPGGSGGPAKTPAEKELATLLLDLSRRSLSELADPIHAIIENLVFAPKVAAEARGNAFDVFATEGLTQRMLENLAFQQVIRIPVEQGDMLRKALLESSAEAKDIRNNMLRVVYLRITSP